MLKNVNGLDYAKDLLLEWEQCLGEGLDVASRKEEVDAFLAQPDAMKSAGEAERLGKLLTTAPTRSDFAYTEPSAYAEIQAELSPRRHSFAAVSDRQLLEEKIAGAWIGRIAGCLLGKPVEGWRTETLYPFLQAIGNYPVTRYIEKRDFTPELIEAFRLNPDGCWADNLNGAAPWDDDTNYTVLALRVLEKYGWDFTSDDILESWLDSLPLLSTYTAERVAYRNALLGMEPPQTAAFHNPFREMIGAQIRGDFFGYINPGEPKKAAEMAFRDASVSHVKNGIYGEMFVAAMLAAAAASDDIRCIIDAGLDEIPQNCRLRRDVEDVMRWYSDGVSAEDIIRHIHSRYDEHTGYGWCSTNSNAMIVTMGLLCGEGDFGRSVCLAVQAAFDTDCNGATVGSIVGMWKGKAAIPPHWYTPFAQKLATTLPKDALLSVDELVKRTMIFLSDEKQ